MAEIIKSNRNASVGLNAYDIFIVWRPISISLIAKLENDIWCLIMDE